MDTYENLKQKAEKLFSEQKKFQNKDKIIASKARFTGKAFREFFPEAEELFNEVMENNPFGIDDSKQFPKILYMLLNDMKEEPLCKECGKEKTKFQSFHRGYLEYCGYDCAYKSKDRLAKIKTFEKGRETWNKGLTKETSDLVKQYGENGSKTKLRQYASGEITVWSKGLTKETDPRLAEAAKTMSESKRRRYKEFGLTEREQAVIDKMAELNRGRPYDDRYEKARQTNMERYGVPSMLCLPETHEKSKAALFKKYGSYGWMSCPDMEETKEKGLAKMYATNIEKYGGVMASCHPKTMEKVFKTKRENGTFGTSEPEERLYEILDELFLGEVERQYRTEAYPFNCDFYIPAFDLYIELQGHWTHGREPFEGTEEQLLILEDWKTRESDYYRNAIDVWTDMDVRKRKSAEENNLNYIEIFNTDFDTDQIIDLIISYFE